MARKHLRHVLCKRDAGPGRESSDLHVKSGRKPGNAELSIPNIITLGRIILVPFIVWAIASDKMEIAFVIFIVAGISDAVDGFLAKRFNMASELGALLDPLADKALLVSIYVALGIWGAVPRWIVILVVSRDIMIVSAVMTASGHVPSRSARVISLRSGTRASRMARCHRPLLVSTAPLGPMIALSPVVDA